MGDKKAPEEKTQRKKAVLGTVISVAAVLVLAGWVFAIMTSGDETANLTEPEAEVAKTTAEENGELAVETTAEESKPAAETKSTEESKPAAEANSAAETKPAAESTPVETTNVANDTTPAEMPATAAAPVVGAVANGSMPATGPADFIVVAILAGLSTTLALSLVLNRKVRY